MLNDTVPEASLRVPITWERLLTEKHKVFFSSHVYLEKGFANEFYYQNAGHVAEEIVAVFFDIKGKRIAEIGPITGLLKPGEALIIDAASAFTNAGYSSFRGSIMVVVHPTQVVEGDDLSQRDFVCFWSSGSQRHACHIGLGGLKEQNVPGKKESKIYNMFCPTVLSTDSRKTVIVILNHSTDPAYADEVTLRPALSNLHGEHLEGSPVTAPAFGVFLIDIKEVFGEKGEQLLEKTGGRGTVTVLHKGHTFITLFFHIDTKTHEIISGTHTSPAASIPHGYAIERPLINAWAEKTPLFYWMWKLKHFRTLDWFVNIFPERPLMFGSLYSYLRQSRFVLQAVYLLRALYFLLRRGFRIDVLPQVQSVGNLKHVVEHNLWENFNIFHFSRSRIEKLLYLLKLVPADFSGKTLCIGPRNEGEILLFRNHGFKDVIGIDLFTYSPNILLMDAHRLTFPDNTFSTINCGWVLTYLYDLRQAISEIIRVAKPGALISCSYTVPLAFNRTPSVGTNMDEHNIAKIIELFGTHVGHVYWRDDDPAGGGKHHLVFRLVK